MAGRQPGEDELRQTELRFVRRLLGVYVGKPADTDAEDNREECLTGNSTDWWTKGGRN